VHYQYYIRTDIKDFFTQVPKDALLAIVTEHTDDPKFDELLKSAIQVELANIAELKEHKDLFPLSSRGVAQDSGTIVKRRRGTRSPAVSAAGATRAAARHAALADDTSRDWQTGRDAGVAVAGIQGPASGGLRL
jgi:hypothetical protein